QPQEIAVPANTDDLGLRDGATNLVAYAIRTASRHTPQLGLVVKDRFGTITLETKRADRLLVPTGTALDAPAAAPTGTLGAFACYTVRIGANQPEFQEIDGVSAVDAIDNRRFDLERPSQLCLPASVNGSAANPDGVLLCYAARPAMGEPE